MLTNDIVSFEQLGPGYVYCAIYARQSENTAFQVTGICSPIQVIFVYVVNLYL